MKEWKYRFKRGLASILTVGMIAGGVSGAVCLPVFAVEGTTDVTVTPAGPEEELKKVVYAGLKEQILGIFDENNSRDKAEFTVVVDFENQGDPDSNKELVQKVSNSLQENTSELLLGECSSKMFWYDSSSEELDGKKSFNCLPGTYIGKPGQETQIITTTFVFRFAVKQKYRLSAETIDDKAISMDIEKIRDKVTVVGNEELEAASGQIYNGLKEEISKMLNKDNPDGSERAEFIVRIPCKNKDMRDRLNENLPSIVESLLSDRPSDFFWYNPSGELANEKSYICRTYYNDNTEMIRCTFQFAVKDEYSNNDDDALSLNVEEIKKFKNSVDDILNDQDNESADYFILQTYREAACKYEKVSPGEGSNIFQSLCNNATDFKSGTVCYTVRGTRVQGDDSKPYTWNLVGIKSKISGNTEIMYYYLVDIAECAKGNSAEYFLVGAQKAQQDGYTIANGTTYIPEEGSQSFNISGLKYKQDQDDFRFVKPEVKFDGMGITGVLGEKDIIVEVAGNVYSNISFNSTNQAVATIDSDQTSPYQAQIHMKSPGITVIWARAYETDSHALREIRFTLSVSEKEGTQPPTQDPENPGNDVIEPVVPGTPGSGGGGGGAIGGGSSVGSGGSGSVGTTATTALGLELIAQTDFTFDVGYAKILKTVGAPDFTITAGGQVAGSDVTYESSDTSVATVDAKTGAVHIVGTGNAKIIATASATDIHKEATCEYKLEVVKEEGNIYN